MVVDLFCKYERGIGMKKILAVVCTFLVLLCAFPVQAAARVAEHGCVGVPYKTEKLAGYVFVNQSQHRVRYREFLKCQFEGCPQQMGNRIVEVLESHNWSSYDSVGCGGAVHWYTLTCQDCNGKWQISIICHGDDTGYHPTPW